MQRVELANRTSDGSAAKAALEIIAGAAGLSVVGIEVYLAAATASVFGLGFPAAKGITPTTPVTGLCEDNVLATVLGKTALAWGTGPTAPAHFFKRIYFPATIGSYVKWEFKNGLYVAPGTTLVLWNIGTGSDNGIADVNVAWDE